MGGFYNSKPFFNYKKNPHIISSTQNLIIYFIKSSKYNMLIIEHYFINEILIKYVILTNQT